MTDFPSLLLDTLALDASPSAVRSALWTGLVDFAAEELIQSEGVGAWLYRRWRDAGQGQSAQGPLHASVRSLATAELGMVLRVERAAAEALGVLEQAGFEVVLLKGLAYRAAASSFPYLDARSTTDIDVLVAPPQAEPAWDVLRRAGFVPTSPPSFPKPGGHHHLDGLWSDCRVTIELHTSTSSARAPEESWRRIRASAETRDWNGLRVLVPCATELLWHAVEHSFTHGAAGFTLRQFLPGAALLAAGAPIDVDQIQYRVAFERLREGDGSRFASAAALGHWLAMAAALAGPAMDPGVWRGGYDRLWRLLSWRLALIRRLPAESRLRPYLAVQGTRAELGLHSIDTTSHSSPGYRARYRTLGYVARLAYGLLKAKRAG